jgi:alkylhydroperoxidase family enzyme
VITRVSEGPIENDLYAEMRRHFNEKELTDLTLAVIAINGWNRLAIPFRRAVGPYCSARAAGRTTAAAS